MCVNVKRMKSRRELNALAMTMTNNVSIRRTSRSSSAGRQSNTKPNEQQRLSVSSDCTDSDKERNIKYTFPSKSPLSCATKPRTNDFSSKYRTQLNFCAVSVIIVCLAASLLMLWIFQDMKEQAGFLKDNVQEVVAGNRGVPDALHLCHTISKQLEHNQTEIYALVTQLSTQLLSVTDQLETIGRDLASVQDRMRLTPELVNIPNDVKTLTNSVTSFGSDIKDLKNTVKHITDAQQNMNIAMKALASNFTEINDRMDLFEDGSIDIDNNTNTNTNNSIIDIIMKNITSNSNNTISNVLANGTISNNQIQWIKKDKRNHQKILENLLEKSEELSMKFDNITGELNQVKTRNSIISLAVQNLTMKFQSFTERYKSLKDGDDNNSSTTTFFPTTIVTNT